MLQCLDHIGDKALRVYIGDIGLWTMGKHKIAHRLHEVGFTQPYAAVDKNGL